MVGIVHRRGWSGAALAVVLLGVVPMAGCKVLTIDEDRAIRARQGGSFDEARYVDGIWGARVLPAIGAAAVPLDTLIPAISSGSGLERAGASLVAESAKGRPGPSWSAHPASGETFELSAIAAVVLGGASLSGGRGTIDGRTIGACVIGTLSNGMVMMGVGEFWQRVIKGTVIVAAVILDQLQGRLAGAEG